MSSTQKTAAILVIGNEILSGRTLEKNVQYIAQQLTILGITLTEVRVIPDIKSTIMENVLHFHQIVDYVFTSGGIGPTHDDITAASVAEAFGATLERHAEAVRRLEAHYAGTDQELNEARLKMAEIPEGAALIDNPISAAPGFILKNVHVMAGVPRILQAMFEGIIPTLSGGPRFFSHSITTTIREGDVAAALGNIQDAHNEVDIGSYPYFRDNQFGVSIVVRSQDEAAIGAVVEEIKAALHGLPGEVIDG